MIKKGIKDLEYVLKIYVANYNYWQLCINNFVLILIMKVKQFISQNKISIAAVLFGVAAVGGFAYWYSKKSTTQQKPKNVEQANTPNSQPPNYIKTQSPTAPQVQTIQQEKPTFETYDEKFAKIINKIRGQLDQAGNEMTPQIIKTIISGQYDLCTEDMKSLTQKSRRERRQFLNDGLEYAKILTKYQYDLQEIQEKHLGVILARFDINKALWKQQINKWQEIDAEGMSDLIRDEEQKLLLSYRSINSKPKDYLFLQKVLNYKLRQLEVLNPQSIGADLAADDAGKYEIIQNYVNDLVFDKFNIEQEDIEYSINQLYTAQKQKVIKIEDKIAQVMETFIEIQMDNKESEYC